MIDYFVKHENTVLSPSFSTNSDRDIIFIDEKILFFKIFGALKTISLVVTVLATHRL